MSALKLASGLSLLVFSLISAWYVAPWLKSRARADALTPLLWIHVFRYVALQIYAAQMAGLPVSDGRRDQVVVGDLAAVLLAMASLLALRGRSRLAIPLAWTLMVETIADVALGMARGRREPTLGMAHDVTWLIAAYFLPFLWVSVVVTVWQLVSRRGEALSRAVVGSAAGARATPTNAVKAGV